jgi:hypothetical protein
MILRMALVVHTEDGEYYEMDFLDNEKAKSIMPWKKGGVYEDVITQVNLGEWTHLDFDFTDFIRRMSGRITGKINSAYLVVECLCRE